MRFEPHCKETIEIFQRVTKAITQEDGTVFPMAPTMEAMIGIILNYASRSSDEGLAIETFIELLKCESERRMFLEPKEKIQ